MRILNKPMFWEEQDINLL